MAQTHYFPTDRVHFQWDTGNEPVLEDRRAATRSSSRRATSATTRSGPDCDDRASSPAWTGIASTRSPARSPCSGAEPGDTLAVEILDLHTRGWGWTAILPGLGLLADDFPDPYLRVFDLSDGDFIHFRDDIAIPITPFFGTMGVCPRGASAQPVMPPGTFGGNMDTRQLTKGTTLFLPVQVHGRAVQLRRRARGPGRRRGLRDRSRVADVRGAAIHRAEGAHDPHAAVRDPARGR